MRAAIDALIGGDRTLSQGQVARWLDVARTVGAAHRFFHWPIEFADIFYDAAGRPRRRPGFDAVVGNPPWEMLRRDAGMPAPEDAGAAARSAPGRLVRFIRESGRYPSCRQGHVNLYQPFLELALSIGREGGRIGLVLPWGLAADDGAAALRSTLFERASVDAIVGLDNGRGLFPIHRGLRFLVLVASPGGSTHEFRARFGVRTNEDIASLPDADDDADRARSQYPVRLTPRLLSRISGPARRIPDLRHDDQLEFLEQMAGAHPPLGDASGWGARFGRELNATEDRANFGAVGLPVIEGKHVRPFAVDTSSAALRISERDARRRLPSEPFLAARLAYRDVSGVGNRQSLIAAVVPRGVVTTHTLDCLRAPLPIERQHFLCGLLNSYVLNAVARLLMGGHLTTGLVERLPAPAWTGAPDQRRVARLARRLVERPHPRVHALLQAAVARLYGLGTEAFGRVLATFPLVRQDERTLARQFLARRSPVRRGRRAGSP